MPSEADVSETGVQSRFGWPIGGAVGGIAGAVVFGALMWLFDPETFSTAIPALYGAETGGTLGWLFHLVHGVVLGVVFGFLVTRGPVLGVLRTDVETDALARIGGVARIAAAGFAYGLAVWTILPLIVLPVWVGTIGGVAAGEFPGVAIESMLGHLLFGLVLGIVFAAIVDLSNRSTPDPLEEDGERATAGGDR